MLGRNSPNNVIANARPTAQTGQMNLMHASFLAHVVNQVVRFAAFANKGHKLWASPPCRFATRLRQGFFAAGFSPVARVVEKMPLHSIRCKQFILLAAIKISFARGFGVRQYPESTSGLTPGLSKGGQ
jgi:hypothetical protein